MKQFRTLDLAMEIYEEASKLRLKAPLQNQYDRALLSIVLNLSEGSAKPTVKDRTKFYFISYGSLREVRTILKLSKVYQYEDMMDKLSAYIWKLTNNP